MVAVIGLTSNVQDVFLIVAAPCEVGHQCMENVVFIHS